MPLDCAVPASVVEAGRGQDFRERGRRRPSVPTAIEREVERLSTGRGGRREVEAPEYEALIGESIARESVHGGRDSRIPKDLNQARHRIGGDPGRLQSQWIRIEQRVQIIRTIRQHLDAQGFNEVETPTLHAIISGTASSGGKT